MKIVEETLTEFNKNVKIIAHTAYVHEGEKEKTQLAGCNDYISKPVKRNELLNLIGKYFSN